MPLAGAVGTSREGDGGQAGGGGKAVYCEMVVGLGFGVVVERDDGSGFEDLVKLLDCSGGVAIAPVDED